ncbi:MAG: TIGR00730 family Rossman fold protein [Patescibacteria group bacterium]|nr:TIGR00730 family Rossman fold protein [Patescibacteria group bacterium]
MIDKDKQMVFKVRGKDVHVSLNREQEFLSPDTVDAKNYASGLSWRILKIQSEFVKGHDFLSKFDKAASIFGSARMGFDNKVYQEAEKLAYKLAKKDFAVFTGGGPGIMEAANKGAHEAEGRSVGININLPHHKITERKNSYITDSESFDFFFSRKVILSFASQVYIFFPGGFGTLDEFFEMVTLIQTKKTRPVPIILVNKEYWGPLLDWIRGVVWGKNRAIAEEDMDLFHLVDTAEEACDLIDSCMEKTDE